MIFFQIQLNWMNGIIWNRISFVILFFLFLIFSSFDFSFSCFSFSLWYNHMLFSNFIQYSIVAGQNIEPNLKKKMHFLTTKKKGKRKRKIERWLIRCIILAHCLPSTSCCSFTKKKRIYEKKVNGKRTIRIVLMHAQTRASKNAGQTNVFD